MQEKYLRGGFFDPDLVQEGRDRLQEGGDVGDLVDRLAELAAVRQAVGVPAGELAELVEGEGGMLALGHHAEVVEDEVAAVGEGGLGHRAPLQAGGDLLEEPGVAGGAAPHHDAVAAALGQHAQGVRGLTDVPIADHRDGEGLLEAGQVAPVGLAGEHLAGRAGVHGDRGDAVGLADPAQLQVVAAAVVEPQAELDGERDRDDVAHGADDRLGELEVTHQGGAGAPLEDLVGRAPHVDVADVGAELLDHQGGLAHGGGVGAVDLDGERALLRAEIHQLAGPLVAVDDRLRGDELHRHHPPAADPPHDEAEIAVGHPGHGSEPERGIDAEGAERDHRMGIVTRSVAWRFPGGGTKSGDAPPGRTVRASLWRREAAQEILTTFLAWSPFGPSTTSKLTRSPSLRVRNPSAMMEAWWTKTSAPRSRTMKP